MATPRRRARVPVPRPDPVRRLLPAALGAVLALTAPDLAAQSVDGQARRSLEQAKQALQHQRRKADEAERAVAAVRAELDALRQRSIRAAEALQAEETALAEIERRLAALADEEARKTAALNRENRELAAALASLSRLARRSPTALLTDAGPPLDSYRGIRLVAAVSQGLQTRVGALRVELAALTALREEIAGEERRHRRQADALAAHRAELARLLDDKARLEARLAGESREAAERVASMAREAADLGELVDKLAEAEAERRREAAERAEAERQAQLARLAELARRQAELARRQSERERLAQLPTPPLPRSKPTPRPVSATETARAAPVAAMPAALALPPPAEPFSEARGKLPMPARGRIVEVFGERNRQGQFSHGIMIQTMNNAQVIAPYDGEVVFAGQFRRYGLLLIISMGEGYHILLSGMSRLHGVVGQQVLAGEPIGEMGGIDAGTPRLYVELRRKGEPINPLPWLSAAKGKISG